MELLHCKYCSSNLVNIIALKIKHGEYDDRNINIQKNYVSMKEPQAIKCFLRCSNCTKVSELLLKNQRGCCSWSILKNGEDKEPQNEIISVEEGGRFN